VTRWSAEPAYRRIAAEWAEAIDDGAVADGQQLPTRQKLMQEHGVSLQVVRDALNLLHHEGYLRSESAKGTFVHRPPRLTLPMYTFEDEDRLVDAFTAVIERQEHRPKQDIEVHVLRPPAGIARSLRLNDDELALVRRRIRYVDDVPYALADSYYPEKLVAGTVVAKPENVPTGLRHVLAELGYPMVHHDDCITARRPHKRELQQLSLAPGLPVIAHNRTSYYTAGRENPIRVLASVLPADRWELTYEVES
jgi:GntR family transcriptional regulator